MHQDRIIRGFLEFEGSPQTLPTQPRCPGRYPKHRYIFLKFDAADIELEAASEGTNDKPLNLRVMRSREEPLNLRVQAYGL